MNASSRIDLDLHLARRRAAGPRHVWLGRVRADVKNKFFFGAIDPYAYTTPLNGFIGLSFKPSMIGIFFYNIFLNFKKNLSIFFVILWFIEKFGKQYKWNKNERNIVQSPSFFYF